VITWEASAVQPPDQALWYRFRVRAPGEDFRTVRDFGPESTLDWTASDGEGYYSVEVAVRNVETGETNFAFADYQMASRVADGPAISATANPLVFLYSAPACPLGSRMRVQFQASDGTTQYTPYKPCRAGRSMNFFLAGLRADSRYTAKHLLDDGSRLVEGPSVTLATTTVSPTVSNLRVVEAPAPGTSGILLQSPLSLFTVATDLSGNVVWYYPQRIALTRPLPGGLFLGFFQNPTGDPARQFLREVDLAGTTVRETNAARLNEQLAALGMRSITAFHHEVAAMPDGRLLVLAGTEQLTDLNGSEPVDVLGDMILVLDRDLQVVWVWDAFDHLDTRRGATLKETCTPAAGGCPPFSLAPRANDWLHANSLQFTPDGNILMSLRHQDWVIKIDYRNGAGTGQILWRLGKDGDFQARSDDPNPWFSHQHDAQIVDTPDGPVLIVFDNGNIRQASDPNVHSRGQAWRLDEVNRLATPVLNADLGAYSFALGSAQRLPNGNYHFELGILPDRTSQSVEVDPTGRLVYNMSASDPLYRTFRMTDLYTP
jgi:hypothetical protein